VTSPRPQREPFSGGSDREADDKVPEAFGYGFVPASRRGAQQMPFASLTGLKTRLRDRVDSTARGSDVPAGIERGADALAPNSTRNRGRMRRRLRELRRLREAQLLELGALALEAHRHGRDASSLIAAKAAEAAATDAEARGLADALETDAGLERLIATGIAGPCPTCGTLASTAARFCSNCGTPLDGRPGATARTPIGEDVETPLVDARIAHDSGQKPDDATTELPAANGDGQTPDEIEAATGREA
jgi:hypothetical protein